MNLIKVRQEIDSLLCVILGIRKKPDRVNQEIMVKKFMREWANVVESLRKPAIAQFKSRGKVKV